MQDCFALPRAAAVTLSLAENKEGNGETIVIQASAISPSNRAREKIPKFITEADFQCINSFYIHCLLGDKHCRGQNFGEQKLSSLRNYSFIKEIKYKPE